MTPEYDEHLAIEDWKSSMEDNFQPLLQQGYKGIFVARDDIEVISVASDLSTLIEDIIDYVLEMKNKHNDKLEQYQTEYIVEDFLSCITIKTFWNFQKLFENIFENKKNLKNKINCKNNSVKVL